MAAITSDQPVDAEPRMAASSEDAVLLRLAALEREVAEGNREARRTGNAFMIFALFALIFAMVTLAAVLAEVGGSSTVTVNGGRTGPMMGSGAGTTVAPAAVPARHIGVSLAEYSVGLSSSVGRAGVVSFAVRNAGTMPHEFVVIRTPKRAADLLKGTRADETGNVGETGDLQPGAAKTLHLRLTPGHYALICNLPGHYMAGQHADFTVR